MSQMGGNGQLPDSLKNDLDKLNRNIARFEKFVNGPDKYMVGTNGNKMTKNCAIEILTAMKNEVNKHNECNEKVTKNHKKTIDKTKTKNYINNTKKQKSTTKNNKRSTMENTKNTIANMKKTLTKKQLAQFESVYHHFWAAMSKTINYNNKQLRSKGFATAQIECMKLLKKIY